MWVSPLFLFIGHFSCVRVSLISFACLVFTVVPFTSCVYCPGVPVPELVVPVTASVCTQVRSRTPKPRTSQGTSAPPGTRRSAATDAVRLAPSPLPLPRLGAVAISVTTTALDGVCGAVCGDACVPGFGCGLARFGCGLARESVGGLVLRGFGLCGSCVCPVCVPAAPGVFLPVSC